MPSATLPNILRPSHRDDLVRVGGPNDGGYVTTETIVRRTTALASFGLSNDWTFEEDFIRRKHGALTVHCYDHSVGPRAFLKTSALGFARLMVEPSRQALRAAGDFRRYRKFVRTPGVTHYREPIGYRGTAAASIDKVVERLGENTQIFVKMDIEGSEYRVFRDFAAFADQILGLVIEFHDVDFATPQFLDAVGHLKKRYDLVHIHANNFADVAPNGWPPLMELSFERANLSPHPSRPSTRSYPLPGIDAPNNPGAPEITLMFEEATRPADAARKIAGV